MTKKQAILTYLVLLFAIIPLAIMISWYRAGMGAFDLVSLSQNSATLLWRIMMTVGVAVGANVLFGYLFRRPGRVLVWIPVATGLVVFFRGLVASQLGLTALSELGFLNVFLMYLPSVALFSLIGGLLATLMFERVVSKPIGAS